MELKYIAKSSVNFRADMKFCTQRLVCGMDELEVTKGLNF